MNWLIFIVFALTAFSCKEKSHQNATMDSRLRILTYNVWYGFTRVPERKSVWLNWMKDQHADIVFLQELNEYSPEKLKNDAAFWGHAYSVLLKQDGFPTGVTSRHPIEDVQRMIEGFHHGLIRIRIDDIYFYNIHLHPSNCEFRNKEINLILDNVKTLPLNSKVVLAGDFNSFSPQDSSHYSDGLTAFFAQRDIDYEEHNLNRGSLDYSTLAWLIENRFTDTEYTMRDDTYTFTGSFPTSLEKPGDDGPRRRLDYIFVSRNLVPRIHSASIISNDTTLFLSDHLPVIADFNIE